MVQAANHASRLRDFEEALSARYGSYAIQPTTDIQLVSGRIADTCCGPLTISRVDVSGITSCRAELPARLQNRAFLLMPRQGRLVADQYGRTVALEPADMMLLDSRSGCSLASPGASRNLVIEMEREAFGQFHGAVEDLCGRRIPGDRGMGRVLARFIDNVTDEIDASSSVNAAMIQSMIIDLFGCCIEPAEDQPQWDAASKIMQMRTWLMAHVAEPSLTPENIADEFGLSRRGLYRLFVSTGTTPARWMWQVRLDCAYRRLTSPASAEHSITEIAYAAGFNDMSHFARLFKRRFGLTPSELRGQSER